jgi:hypothetical protein
MEKLVAFLTSYINVFKITDLIDIALVALAIYWLIKLIKETNPLPASYPWDARQTHIY